MFSWTCERAKALLGKQEQLRGILESYMMGCIYRVGGYCPEHQTYADFFAEDELCPMVWVVTVTAQWYSDGNVSVRSGGCIVLDTL